MAPDFRFSQFFPGSFRRFRKVTHSLQENPILTDHAQPIGGRLSLRRPVPTLSPRQLSLLFGLVLLCPIAVGTSLYLILPKAHDRPLSISVELVDPQQPSGILRLKNNGDVPLHGLRIELNGAFAYFPREPLPPEQTTEVSLQWFMKKTGQRLQATQTPIRKIDVSARLPGNQRAVYTESFPDK